MLLSTPEAEFAPTVGDRCRNEQVVKVGGGQQKEVARPVDGRCCYGCGCPLTVGDTAHFDLSQGTAYCSGACARHNGVAETWTAEEILQQVG
jgi:hypothetical protein